jgi:hypothetical protein
MSDDFSRSGEIRWFLPGHSLKDQLLDWFKLPEQPLVTESEPYTAQPEALPFVKLEKRRDDDYLLLPDCGTVGVKQREGKLEVKALVAGPHFFSLDEVVGQVDQWVKWSFSPSKEIFEDPKMFAQQLKSGLLKSGPWCTVVKNRYLQKVSFDSGSLASVSPDKWPDTGCNIELTVIGAGAGVEPWITFGFEAFGPSDRITAMLDEAVEHFFALHGSPPAQLDKSNSLSYPMWLTKLR